MSDLTGCSGVPSRQTHILRTHESQGRADEHKPTHNGLSVYARKAMDNPQMLP